MGICGARVVFMLGPVVVLFIVHLGLPIRLQAMNHVMTSLLVMPEAFKPILQFRV